MTHHHHNAVDTHLSPVLAPSLLRMAAWERLALALAVAAVLWLAVWWALA